MFGLGFSEILVIMVVALLLFGPERLPELAKTIGKTMGQLRRAMDDVRSDLAIDRDLFDLNASPRKLRSTQPALREKELLEKIESTGLPAAPVSEPKDEAGK